MTYPRDPFLRAVFRVGRAKDLTPTERLALLALWRFLGVEAKAIGPSLLAALIGTTAGHAKKVLHSLLTKGYVTSSGRWRPGGVHRAATRQLTDKIKWPKRPPGSNHPGEGVQSPGSNQSASKRSPGGNCPGGGNERSPGSNHRYPDGSADRYPDGSNDLGVRQASRHSASGDVASAGGEEVRGITKKKSLRKKAKSSGAKKVSLLDLMTAPTGDKSDA